MELNHDFTVPVPRDRAWEVLTDIEGIAPCLPGAQLQEVEGDEYRGIVKVKVGPITAQYKGAAVIESQDAEAGTMVIDASGRDTRGQGNASAKITLQLTDNGDTTDVSVATDLTISGKVAQFGRGMLADVSSKLLGQFVECLEGKIDDLGTGDAAEDEAPAAEEAPAEEAATEAPAAEEAAAPEAAPAPAAANGAAAKPTVRKINAPEAAPVDLGDAAGGAVAKRALPVIVVVLLLLLLGRRRKRS